MSEHWIKPPSRLRLGVIEGRIALSIVVFSTAIALFATVFQIYVDYRKDVNALNKNFNIIEKSYLHSLSTSLWVMDPSQIQSITKGIQSLPNVAFTKVRWDNGDTIVTLGQRPLENKLEKTFDLNYSGRKGIQKVGTITVVLSLDEVIMRSYDRILLILLTNSLKTMIVCLFIFYVLRKSITKHLNHITAYLKKGDQAGSLSLQGIQKDDKNELAIVSTAINEMETRLRDNINELEAHKSELEENVREKTKALKESFEEKTNLLRVVCHDLANPLSIISGSAEMLQNLPLPDDKKLERYEAIVRASALMNDILINVREMESVTSGKKSINLVPVNLLEIFESIQFVFKDRLAEKNIQVNIENNLSPDTRCLADPITLSNQVLSNLISNAIKFSFKDSTIDIIANEDQNGVHIIVRDHGVGMSQQHLAEIFDSKRQTTRVGTDGETGTGFGMPLVKTFVERYGGELSVESVSADENPQSHGSSFHLHLKTAS